MVHGGLLPASACQRLVPACYCLGPGSYAAMTVERWWHMAPPSLNIFTQQERWAVCLFALAAALCSPRRIRNPTSAPEHHICPCCLVLPQPPATLVAHPARASCCRSAVLQALLTACPITTFLLTLPTIKCFNYQTLQAPDNQHCASCAFRSHIPVSSLCWLLALQRSLQRAHHASSIHIFLYNSQLLFLLSAAQ